MAELQDWLPMSPMEGPPLPRFLGINWPWYKEGAPPPPPQPLKYSCPYCDQSFDTLAELIAHGAQAHPDQPPIGEIEIKWE
jgi:hypothetical protein